jgi:antitoxin ParD1/3/4
MATMNISLPDQMKEWVEQQVATGRYANASDYMRDLVRKDQLHVDAVAKLQKIVDDALASGISDKSVDEIFADARRKAIKAAKGKDAAA